MNEMELEQENVQQIPNKPQIVREQKLNTFDQIKSIKNFSYGYHSKLNQISGLNFF
jgi:hypothetical protein